MSRPSTPLTLPQSVPPTAAALLAGMQAALVEAREAARMDEVPVGAVVLFQGEIIARAHNLREHTGDPLAHAELLALRSAAQTLGRWRLWGCTLLVTLEPCAMCAGAIVNSRLERLVFAANDPKAGFVGSLADLVQHPKLNHRAIVSSGLCASESQALLQQFFRRLRARNREA